MKTRTSIITEIKSHLNKTQLAQIEELCAKCSLHDKIQSPYSFYTGDTEYPLCPPDTAEQTEASHTGKDLFALCFNGTELVAYAYICFCEPAELSGVVHPAFRRRHIFSATVKSLLERANIKPEHCEFAGQDFYPGFAECAAALGAPHKHGEYLMRFTADFIPAPSVALNYTVEQGDDTVFFFQKENTEIGCAAIAFDGSTANICGVYIEPEFRGRGLGYEMLCTLLRLLLQNDVTSAPGAISASHVPETPSVPDAPSAPETPSVPANIILHVSGRNKTAMALYTKCGFEIIDSVIFYSRSR